MTVIPKIEITVKIGKKAMKYENETLRFKESDKSDLSRLVAPIRMKAFVLSIIPQIEKDFKLL